LYCGQGPLETGIFESSEGGGGVRGRKGFLLVILVLYSMGFEEEGEGCRDVDDADVSSNSPNLLVVQFLYISYSCFPLWEFLPCILVCGCASIQ